MSTWNPGTWTMWEKGICTYIYNTHTYQATAVSCDEVTEMTALCPCCSCSPGSSSQKKIPATARPRLCPAPPPSWHRSPHQLPPHRSFRKIWIWGCRSLPIPTGKYQGRALLWWDLNTVIFSRPNSNHSTSKCRHFSVMLINNNFWHILFFLISACILYFHRARCHTDSAPLVWRMASVIKPSLLLSRYIIWTATHLFSFLLLPPFPWYASSVVNILVFVLWLPEQVCVGVSCNSSLLACFSAVDALHINITTSVPLPKISTSNVCLR